MNWRAYTEELIERLVRRRLSQSRMSEVSTQRKPDVWVELAGRLPAPRRLENLFSTEAFLHDVLKGEMDGRESDVLLTLEALCRKVEVSRLVRVAYGPGFSTLASEPLAPDYVASLAAVLLSRADDHDDAKFLNTAFKILDRRLQQPNPIFPANLRTWGQQLLERLCNQGCDHH